ncbi:MAG: RluA family pseudouridine synthase [Spirochaeta sp.]|nr:RluA family pseudouridine synthase [Spirochaeta sp.]
MPQLYELGPDDDGRRLDRILRKLLTDHALGDIYALFRKRRVKLNGKRVAGKDRASAGDQLLIYDSELSQDHGKPVLSQEESHKPKAPSMHVNHEAEVAPLVVFENADLLILNKPRGVTAHGEHSLLPQILSYLYHGRTASLSFTPGPVHRLDRNTTGLIVYAKTLQGARRFSHLLQSRALHKRYLAVLEGKLEQHVTWIDVLHRDYRTHTSRGFTGASQAASRAATQAESGTPENATAAETTVTPLWSNGSATLALLEPKTGRTHQIRAQAALHEHPLVGDRKYGAPAAPYPYILHAFELDWKDPTPQRVLAPLPPEAASQLSRLFGAQHINKLLGELGL